MEYKNSIAEAQRSFKRGDIYYIESTSEDGVGYGSAMDGKTRPGIIVSNDLGNMSSTMVSVVFLTSQTKKNMLTHVELDMGNGYTSTVTCEQVYSVDKNRIKNFVRRCTCAEMRRINKAISYGLGLNEKQYNKSSRCKFNCTSKLLNDVSKYIYLLNNKCIEINEIDKKIEMITAETTNSILSSIIDEEDMNEVIKVATRKKTEEKNEIEKCLLSLIKPLTEDISKVDDNINLTDIADGLEDECKEEVKDTVVKDIVVKDTVVKEKSSSVKSYDKKGFVRPVKKKNIIIVKNKKNKKEVNGTGSERVTIIAELFKEGYSVDDIAELLDIKKQAIYSAKNYAKRCGILTEEEINNSKVNN